jgi:hypothetical protein
MKLLNELQTICHRTGIKGFFFESEEALMEVKKSDLEKVVRDLLTKNNTLKLWNFNLPAGKTCPGSTVWCGGGKTKEGKCVEKGRCYGVEGKGKYGVPNVAKGQHRRWDATKHPMFVEAMVSEIKRKRDNFAIRIHGTGDLYTVKYFNRWLKIIKRLPDRKFYLYTRLWRKGTKWRERLDKAEDDNPNLTIWWSTDPTSGVPKKARRLTFVDDEKYGGKYHPDMPDVNCAKQLSKDGKDKGCSGCDDPCYTKDGQVRIDDPYNPQKKTFLFHGPGK